MFGDHHEAQLHRIERAVIGLMERIDLMSLDLTKLNAGESAAIAAIAALRAENADLKTQLAAATAKQEDPADQAAVDKAGDDLAGAATPPA
jgi:regulator of replication initiation timing